MFFLIEVWVWVRIFGKPANYYNLGKQWPLTILFSLLLHSLPMLHPPLRVLAKTLIIKLTSESFRFGIYLKFNGLQFCCSVFQWQICSTEICLSLLLITFAPESFWVLFYIPKFVLKLHLDGKLQVTLAYCTLVIGWPLNLTSCGYSKFMKVICAFDGLAYFVHVETPHWFKFIQF